MRIGKYRYRVDWGHLGVIAMMALICTAYLGDTLATSLRINNLLFVLPASIVALTLCLIILPQTVRREALSTSDPALRSKAGTSESWHELGWIALLIVGFGTYVFLMERIGFDLASWLFITLGIYVCGERHPFALLLFPLLATAMIVLGFQALIPYPMHTLLL